MRRKTMPLQVLAAHPVVIITITTLLSFPPNGLAEPKPGCPDKCGNITVPYPFGMGRDCYLEPRFEIICNESSNPPYPVILQKFVVSEISLDFVRIYHNVFNICDTNDSTESVVESSSVHPFSFSHTENKFVAIGSDIFAFITQPDSKNYTTGCASFEGEGYCSCGISSAAGNSYAVPKYGNRPGILHADGGYRYGPGNPYADRGYSYDPGNPYAGPGSGYGPGFPSKGDFPGQVYNNPVNPRKVPARAIPQTCYGIYCCETTFPYDLPSFDLRLNIMSTAKWKDSKPEKCGYAFIAETTYNVSYGFVSSDLHEIAPHSDVVPAVLEWTVGNISCDEARKRNDYACRENSECMDLPRGLGYKCVCILGYDGNPYLPNGCRDVDECESKKICGENAICNNIPGKFSCACAPGYREATKHGTESTRFPIRCIPVRKLPVALVVSLGVGIAIVLLILVAIGFWLHRKLEERKKRLLKRKFFDENGGRHLLQIITGRKVNVEEMKLYIIEDLEKATDCFNNSRILGEGGAGTVFKGMLQDGSIVAIKKSKKVDEKQVDQFANEVFILSLINHPHIVKLLGCCLETEVPLMVYQYASNHTLSHHLHDKAPESAMSWEKRLRIAGEIADALYYLHSHDPPIFHRDIKSSNILLDENFRVIIADFGISRSASVEKAQLTATQMQGTFGYLDPEIFVTGQFTAKSDVYAFGVILAELLTGEKAVCAKREELSLALHFRSAMRNGCVSEIQDKNLVLSEDQKEDILLVAKIAKSCVEFSGVDRPTMMDVTIDLEKLIKRIPEQKPPESAGQNNQAVIEKS